MENKLPLFENRKMVSFAETEDAANFNRALDEAVQLSDGGPIEVQRYDTDHYVEYQIKFQGVITVHCNKPLSWTDPRLW